MPIEDRRLSLAKVSWLLEKWPDRLVKLSNEKHFFSSYLLRDFDNPPYWYWRPVMEKTHVVHSEWRMDSAQPTFNSDSSYAQSRMQAASWEKLNPTKK